MKINSFIGNKYDIGSFLKCFENCHSKKYNFYLTLSAQFEPLSFEQMQHPSSPSIPSSLNKYFQDNSRPVSQQLRVQQNLSIPNQPLSQDGNESEIPSRLRIHSYQSSRHSKNGIQSIQQKQAAKLQKLRGNTISNKQNGLKQSNGIMNQPPHYISNMYTFKNQYDSQTLRSSGDCSVFGSCCAIVKQTQREVYLSPTQLITMNYFNPVRQQPKSLKFINNKSTVGMGQGQTHQRSFFKESNNPIK